MSAKWMRVVACCAFAAVTAGGVAHGATVLTGSGTRLLRRAYTLANNERIVVQTKGCGSSGSDTVLFMFEGMGSSRTTRAHSDDAGISPDPFCSYVEFTNTTGSSKTYEVVGTQYPGTPSNQITYSVWRSSIGSLPNENLTFSAISDRITPSGSYLYETVGKRPGQGGYYIDTVLYVIDTTLGSTNTRFDDDSGMGPLSTLTATLPCSAFNCWLVAGDYEFGGFTNNFQVWRNVTTDGDSDGDGIPNGIEQATGVGTNTGLVDSDGDGLSDFEELKGVAAASLTGVDPSLIMPWQGADPLAQDLFVEVEYMVNTLGYPAHSHNPYAQNNWATFANDLISTFQNDSSFTGRTIVPHVWVSNSLPETPNVSFGNCNDPTQTTDFYDLKNDPAYFDPLRAGIFHYMIIAHRLMKPDCSGILFASGQAEIWGNDVILAMGVLQGATATVEEQHGTFVHELGHNFSLNHGGNDDPSPAPGVSGQNSCVHSSVMNYRYQFPSWGDSSIPAGRRWGFSDGQCPAVGHGCSNTCNAAKCVPSWETSPKYSCTTNNGSCDCDRSEWAIVNLDIPGLAQMSFEQCQGSGCYGAAAELTRSYFLGDAGRFEAKHRRHAAKRRERAVAVGLVEGRDFSVHPETGRLYSVE